MGFYFLLKFLNYLRSNSLLIHQKGIKVIPMVKAPYVSKKMKCQVGVCL